MGYATPETELYFLVFCFGTTFGYILSFSSVRNMYHIHATYNKIFLGSTSMTQQSLIIKKGGKRIFKEESKYESYLNVLVRDTIKLWLCFTFQCIGICFSFWSNNVSKVVHLVNNFISWVSNNKQTPTLDLWSKFGI